MNGDGSKPPTPPPLPLRGTSPKGGSEGLYEFALDFLIGILRTAGNPSGAVRRLPFQGRLDTPQKFSTGGVECGNRFCGEVHVETPRNIGCGQVVISSFCPVDKKSA